MDMFHFTVSLRDSSEALFEYPLILRLSEVVRAELCKPIKLPEIASVYCSSSRSLSISVCCRTAL